MNTPLHLNRPIVSVDFLTSNLKHPDLIILDASTDGASELGILGALHFDYGKKICDQTNPLPHMMPTPELFENEVRSLGVTNSSKIIIYDNKGIFHSPRVYWMFKAMGHKAVAILDGGFPAWLSKDLPTEHLRRKNSKKGNFIAQPECHLFCNQPEVNTALKNSNFTVIDVRSLSRFKGVEPEPRYGLRSGHMPNAINIPYSELLKDGHFKTKKELTQIFSEITNPSQNIIFSCGSGVTACIAAIGAELAGYKKLSVYDGSWCEWGLPSEYEVIKGS